MKILYHFPNPTTLSAGRTIANGYKNAFEDLGHEFKFLTSNDSQEELLFSYNPDIFFTSLSPLHLKFLDLSLLNLSKKNGTKLFVNIPFWYSPLSNLRITEGRSLMDNHAYVDLLKSNNYGDIYYNICEQDDPRMKGFESAIGFKHHTVLLAADKTLMYPEHANKFRADISYIGTNLPEKRSFFRETVTPLKHQYNVKIYGQDWTTLDTCLGYVQKVGQYFNIPFLSQVRKPSLQLSDERKIYSSSLISINVHENYQKKYGDLNERTFKIPLAGGFEIVDAVATLPNYFNIDKEIVVARNKDDWHDKIDYYIKYPTKRKKIIEAGRKKVLQLHTYHNRVDQFLKMYQSIL